MVKINQTGTLTCGAQWGAAESSGGAPRLVRMTAADPSSLPGAATDIAPAATQQWRVVVLDDPVNLMQYVVWVFQRHFGFTHAKAEEHMLEVHQTGCSVLAVGTREKIEVDVLAMHSYGLQAILEQVSDG